MSNLESLTYKLHLRPVVDQTMHNLGPAPTHSNVKCSSLALSYQYTWSAKESPETMHEIHTLSVDVDASFYQHFDNCIVPSNSSIV